MSRRFWSTVVLSVGLGSVLFSCGTLLGFEDHTLGELDGGAGTGPSNGGGGSGDAATGGSSAGGTAASGAGGTSGTTNAGAGGTSGTTNAGAGGTSGTTSAGAGGTSGTTSAGAGGTTSGGSGGTSGTTSGGNGGTTSGGSGGTSGTTSGGNGGTGGTTSSGGAAGSGGSGCVLCEAGSALIHRYSFNGTGTVARDSVGSSDGTIVGTQLSNTGDLDLSGTNQYVDLPNGLISSLSNASLEAWVTWSGGSSWQRIFDFGDNTNGQGVTYLFVTPRALNSSGALRAGFSLNGNGPADEVVVNGTTALPSGTMSQVVVVVDGNILRLYRDGAAESFAGPIGALSSINDVNDWLGRSQFTSDPEFAGTIHEFRIYDAALSAEQVGALFAAGPDAVF